MVRLLAAAAVALTLGASGAGPTAAAVAPDAGGRTATIGSSATSAAAGLGARSLLPAAAGGPEYCPTSAGTTVVVDLTDLGDDVIVRCATGSPSNGLDALQSAGFSTEGSLEDGAGFVCRINGRPSATEPLRLPGDSDYREQCTRTPPTQAHWHYFVASNGGSWQESGVGAASHTPIPGGFEGWSFQLDNSSNVPPAVNPERPGSTGGGGGSSGGSTGGSGGSGSGSGGSSGGGSGGSGDGGSGGGATGGSGRGNGDGSGGTSSGSSNGDSDGGSGSGGSNGGSGSGDNGSAPTPEPSAGTGPVGPGPGSPPAGDGGDGDASDGTPGVGSESPGTGSTSGGTKSGPKKTGGSEPQREKDRAHKQRRDGDAKSDRSNRGPKVEATPENGSDRDEEVVVTGDVPDTPAVDSGSPLATMTGVGVLALLGAGAGVTAWRRRRT